MKNKKYLILPICVLLNGCWETENGDINGQIIALTSSGMFVKTLECKIIRGGMDDGSGGFASSMWLTVENKNLLPKIKKFMNEKKFINIQYHKEFATFCRSDSDNFFINDIEEIKKEKNNE